jgi:iron complex outermembrane receptor protein
VDYTSDSQFGTTLDAGRRFGDSDQFGARVNLVHREGETGVPNDRRRTTLLSTGLDYNGDNVRTSLDLGYQKKTFHGSPTSVNISAVDFVPEPPKNDRNFSQKWAYSNIENEFGMWRSEYDITDGWTAYTGLARSTRTKKGSTARRSCWTKAAKPRSAVWIPTASAIPSAAWRAFAGISIPALSRTRSTSAIRR